MRSRGGFRAPRHARASQSRARTKEAFMRLDKRFHARTKGFRARTKHAARARTKHVARAPRVDRASPVSPANTHSGRLPHREAQSDSPSGVPSRKTPPGPRPALTSGATARLNASTLSNSRRMPTGMRTPKSSNSFRAPPCDHSACRVSAHGAQPQLLAGLSALSNSSAAQPWERSRGSAELEQLLRPANIKAASPASARLAARPLPLGNVAAAACHRRSHRRRPRLAWCCRRLACRRRRPRLPSPSPAATASRRHYAATIRQRSSNGSRHPRLSPPPPCVPPRPLVPPPPLCVPPRPALRAAAAFFVHQTPDVRVRLYRGAPGQPESHWVCSYRKIV